MGRGGCVIWHYDFETYSECDLKKLGAAAYASHESTQILLCAVARGEEAPLIWDLYASEEENSPALALIKEMCADDGEIVAHNYGFEMLVSHYNWEKTFGFPPPNPDRYRCTASMLRTAGLPYSLAGAAEFLKLEDGKDPVGKALIATFSVPQKKGKAGPYRVTPLDNRKVTIAGEKISAAEAWRKFREYCIQDVVVERAIHHRLESLELTGQPLESFQADKRMNLRGTPVNAQAVANAEKLIAEYNETLGQQFREITGMNFTQGKLFLPWLQERGYPAANLQRETVATVLGQEIEEDTEDEEESGEVPEIDPSTVRMTPEARRALQIRSYLNFAALKKLPACRKAACPDGRLRGILLWHGAIRTGRHSSSVVQLHNMKRPVMRDGASEPDTHDVYRRIRDGQMDIESMEMIWGNPLDWIAKSVRHFIDPGPGKRFMDVDLAQVEARVLAWLSGHDELLKAFVAGKDLYKITAALMFGTKYEDVQKSQRHLGKVASLACGYGGGVKAFSTMGQNYGVYLEKEKALEIVKAYRKGNPAIKKFWEVMQDTAVEAVKTPGKWFAATDKIQFGVSRKLGYPALVMLLPSGRKIQYPLPEVRKCYKVKIEDKDGEESWVEIPQHRAFTADSDLRDGVWATNSITYHGPGKGTVKWGRVFTHGGVFVENACQSVTADFLDSGVINAEKAGYTPLFTVHDQGIFEYHPERGNTVDGLVEAFCRLPGWAKGFPLAAEASITEFFTK